MESNSILLWLTCVSVVITNINSHVNEPGRCDFLNYCAHLRQAKVDPIANHPATCPDPNICEKELEFFKKQAPRKVNLKVIPTDEYGYEYVTQFTGCQLEPHCGRIPVKRPTTQLWPSAKYNVPVRCNFVDYCDSLRQYNFHPVGNHPAVCPDPSICGREVESFILRKESRIPLQVLPTDESYFCIGLDTCGKRRTTPRRKPEYIAFKPEPDRDLLPGTCKDLLHCGRIPQRESRPPAKSTPTDAHPGAGRFPQRGGKNSGKK